MSDPVWYYARGETEKGPFSTLQIKALAAAGRIRPEDLVWKEGMENWVPASEIGDLFPNGAGKTTQKEKHSERNDTQPAATTETNETDVTPRAAVFHRDFQALPTCRIITLAGFATVLLSRGCDELANRYVARAQAAITIAQQQHESQWDNRAATLEQEIAKLESLANPSPSQQEQLKKLVTQLAELAAQRTTSQRRLNSTQLAALHAAAELAEAGNDRWAFWRGLAFLIGTCVLAAGLIAVGHYGEGAERWMAWAAAVVLLFSIYNGGAFQ